MALALKLRRRLLCESIITPQPGRPAPKYASALLAYCLGQLERAVSLPRFFHQAAAGSPSPALPRATLLRELLKRGGATFG